LALPFWSVTTVVPRTAPIAGGASGMAFGLAELLDEEDLG